MRTMKLLFSPIAISLAIFLTQAPAKAHPVEHNGPGYLYHILKQLELSDSQRQDLRLLLKQKHADNATLEQDMHTNREALRILEQSTVWNENDIRSLIAQSLPLRAELMWQNLQIQHQLWLTLDTTQKQSFINKLSEKTLPDKPAGRKNNQGRRFEALALTDQQEALLVAQHEIEKANREKNKASHIVFKERMLALISRDELVKSDWLALAQEAKNSQLENAIRQAKNKYDFWNMLTPEQQLKMLEIQSLPRKQMFRKQRHHADDA